ADRRMTPAPPATLSRLRRTRWPLGEELHRIHGSLYASTSFNPCLGRPSRFAPLVQTNGTCVPTMYAAKSFECAVHETIFHELQHNAPRKAITYRQIENLDYAIIRPRRELVLVSLFEPDLNAWGLTRSQLIDTFAADYSDTAKWALAI